MLGGPLERSGFPPPAGSFTLPRCGLFLLRRSHTGVIVARAITDATVDDATTGVELIEAVNDDITRVTAEAYDTVAFYDAAGAQGTTVVVPPTKTARVFRRGPRSSARDRTINKVKRIGRRR